MLFWLVAGGIAYMIYYSNQKVVIKVTSKERRNIIDGGMLLDPVRAQGNLYGIVNGTDELINQKFKRKTMSYSEVQDAAVNRFSYTPGLVDKTKVPYKQINSRPSDDYHFPMHNALSGWYAKATSGNRRPIITNPGVTYSNVVG
jgi:hypothetical protein